MSTTESNGSLYGKIITRDGVLGLIAFMVVMFLITVVYQGQQKQAALLSEVLEIERQQTIEMQEQTDVMKDIRYSMRENFGLTFRNKP